MDRLSDVRGHTALLKFLHLNSRKIRCPPLIQIMLLYVTDVRIEQAIQFFVNDLAPKWKMSFGR